MRWAITAPGGEFLRLLKQKSRSIEIFLHGGLGNQLFGWATAYSLARRLETTLTVNISQLKNRSLHIPKFLLAGTEISTEEPIFYKSNSEILQGLFRKIPNTGSYFEKRYAFETRFNKIDRPKKLYGYFQSFRYFEPYTPEIISMISDEQNLTLQYQKVRKTLPQEFISLHFRRGDYVEKSDFHPLATLDYYEKSIRFLKKNSVDLPIVVFTDDKLLARESFPGSQILSESELESPFDNLYLMSQGEAVIGANSTFSLWASILMRCNTDYRIFPKKWFGDGILQTESPVPSNYTLF